MDYGGGPVWNVSLALKWRSHGELSDHTQASPPVAASAGDRSQGICAIEQAAYPSALTQSHDAHGFRPEAVGGVLPGPLRAARSASSGSIHGSPHRVRT